MATQHRYLPPEIARRLNAKIGSGEFYARAALPPGRSRQLWHRFSELSQGDLEQLVEWHKRRAYAALERFERTGSPHTAETAADHIWRAQRYRMRYRELLGDERPEDFVGNDPVFPELCFE